MDTEAPTLHGSLADPPLLTPSSEPIYASMVADAPALPVNLLQTSTVGPFSTHRSPHEPPMGTLTSAGGLPLPIVPTSSMLQAFSLSIPYRSHSEPLFHPAEDEATQRVQIANAPHVDTTAHRDSSMLVSAAPSVLAYPPRDEAALRMSILEIQRNPLFSAAEKAHQVQNLMMGRWSSKNPMPYAMPLLSLSSEAVARQSSTMAEDDRVAIAAIAASPALSVTAAMATAFASMSSLSPASGGSHLDVSPTGSLSIDFQMDRDGPEHDKQDRHGPVGSSTAISNVRDKSILALGYLTEQHITMSTEAQCAYSAASDSEYIEHRIKPLTRPSDLAPSYHPVLNSSELYFGCRHYIRSCKVFSPCCSKWFPCRSCHDEASDHHLIGSSVKYVSCMNCSLIQPSRAACLQCNVLFGSYYCSECSLWESDRHKKIFHCGECRLCRVGEQDEFFHCSKCNCCLVLRLKGNHKCIERSLECDCPICGEYLFTSTSAVIFMPCGHCIHYKCHQEHTKSSYQCPICWKSLVNMSAYFSRLDQMLAEHQMPPEYANVRSIILCNDCEVKSVAKYHFLYHKCKGCGSYNTKLLQTKIVDSASEDAMDIVMDTDIDVEVEMIRQAESSDISSSSSSSCSSSPSLSSPSSSTIAAQSFHTARRSSGSSIRVHIEDLDMSDNSHDHEFGTREGQHNSAMSGAAQAAAARANASGEDCHNPSNSPLQVFYSMPFSE